VNTVATNSNRIVYAHVLDESIDSRHDGATGEAWLQGRFTYMLYRRPVKNIPEALV
jgi:hypothetical protein